MSDKNKDFTAEETAAVEREGAVTEERDGEEAGLVLKFSKPYVFEGREYTEVDLSTLEDTTAEDLSVVGKILSKLGTVSPMPEMTMDFSQFMAARVTKLPIEFFKRMPAREAIKLKNAVTGFLYGGDGDN